MRTDSSRSAKQVKGGDGRGKKSKGHEWAAVGEETRYPDDGAQTRTAIHGPSGRGWPKWPERESVE